MPQNSATGGMRKILVFAHVPPPHHGQSVMVQVLLDGLRVDPRFEVYHVDARVSDDLEDVGSFRPRKFWRLFKCIWQAWWIRMRHGPMAFYYVPAPAKQSAILRDWVVMALCRPLFPELILHWHAFGLGEWVAAGNDWPRKLTRRALGKADLSIVLNNYNTRDAEVFAPKRMAVVPNGIVDQFADYGAVLREKCEHRAMQLRALAGGTLDEAQKHSNIPRNVGMLGAGALGDSGAGSGGFLGGSRQTGKCETVRFLFLGHLIESKGVFVAIEATRMANEELRKSHAPWRAHLSLAGSFASEKEKARVLAAIDQANKADGDEGPCVTLVGFLDSGQKKSALERADGLVFPTFYENEAQPLVLLEAMSAGLPVITTSWRGVPEVLPDEYLWVVAPRSAAELSRAMMKLTGHDWSGALRGRYLEGYTIARHVDHLASELSG
jgi:glycosyltransferase involved in cell wall biosynthesis